MAGDILREESSSEVKDRRRENNQLKEALAEKMLKNRFLTRCSIE